MDEHGRFEIGDRVLLVDGKGRRYLVALQVDGAFQNHAGEVPHSAIVGQPDASEVSSTRGQNFRAFRPTLADFVLKMKRGAQVIYPKDLGPLLMIADIHPGCRVIESGIGSGALSMTMLRAGAHIEGIELREDFAGRARRNVEAFLGTEALERYSVTIGSAYEGLGDGQTVDRIVLDLPEPWQVVPHASDRLRPGGIIVAYNPSIVQATTMREALGEHGFELAETIEVLNRSWHIDGQAVRPDHRMVAHTGFLTSARLLA